MRKLHSNLPFLNSGKISLASWWAARSTFRKCMTGATKLFPGELRRLANSQRHQPGHFQRSRSRLASGRFLRVRTVSGRTGGGTCIPSATQFCMPIDPTTGAPFPGNIIPTTSFSRLANVAIGAGLFPAPNCFASRLSRKLSPDHRIAQHRQSADLQARSATGPFRLDVLSLYHRQYENQNINGSVSLPFGIGTFNEKSESWMISHTIPLTHNIVNNFRFGRLEPISVQGGIAAPDSDILRSVSPVCSRTCPTMPDCIRD